MLVVRVTLGALGWLRIKLVGHKIMVQRIRRVMLVDDDSTDNFLHRRVLEKSGIVESIVSFEHAEDSLEYLKHEGDIVDLICLDFNMPRMNGAEFLAEYEKLDFKEGYRPAVMILSTSIGPEVETRAAMHPSVVRTQPKPLSIETVVSLSEVMSQRYATKAS